MTGRLMTSRQKEVYRLLSDYITAKGFVVGDKLPSIQQLVKELGLSTKIMQKVLPMLAEDNVIESIPKVGTFVTSLPCVESERVSDDKNLLYFYIAEYDKYSAKRWQQLIQAFEKKYPGKRVEICLNDSSCQYLKQADVILDEGLSSQFYEDRFLEWIDDELIDGRHFFPFIDDYFNVVEHRKSFPVAFATRVLYYNKKYIKDFESRIDKQFGINQLLSFCDDYFENNQLPDDFAGLVLSYINPILFWLGYGKKSFDDIKGPLSNYLERISFEKPPKLLTPGDIVHPGQFPRLTLDNVIPNNNALFCVGTMWQHPFFKEQSNWQHCRLPITDGVSDYAFMSINISKKTSNFELAKLFATFVISHEGQKIISSSNAYLPIDYDAAQGHDLLPYYHDLETYGWFRDDFVYSKYADREKRFAIRYSLLDLRKGRIGMDEMLDYIKEYSNNYKFTHLKMKGNHYEKN